MTLWRGFDFCSFRFNEQFARIILEKERLVTPSRVNRSPTAFRAGLPVPILVPVSFGFSPFLGNAPFVPYARRFRKIGFQGKVRFDGALDLVQPMKHPFDLGSRNVLHGSLEQDDRPPPNEKSEG